MVHRLIYIALAGALGSLCRYGFTNIVHKFFSFTYPWGTLFVNLSGCFLAGTIFTLFDEYLQVPAQLRVAIFIGFLGAFTTFSTFILETGQLLRSSEYLLALINIFLHNILGLVFFIIGIILIKIFF
ncbi:MAG: fluoride efflux transporter CrcB [Deferribacterota bacterium]|nr:fluoride efflux transporter CrcB [Deferribacterota bacterium]